MTTIEVKNFIAGLGIAERDNCYAFKLDGKKQESIGCYPLKRNGAEHIPIGGKEKASYGVFPASFLVHWNLKAGESEQAANALFDALSSVREKEVPGYRIKFCQMLVPEAVYVGTDNDVHEWVVEALIFYERQVLENGKN